MSRDPSENGSLPVAPDELGLLSRAQCGDREAFDQLSLRYRGRLIAFCGRFLASPEAEDATQDTLLLAWRSLAQLNSTGSFATWLYRIARNHCLNLLRRRGAHLSLDDEQSHLFERIAHMEAPPEDRIHARRVVAEVMARLDERDRIILWWHYQEGMTSEEISRKLPPGMRLSDIGVRSRLKRHIKPAIEAVRRHLEGPEAR